MTNKIAHNMPIRVYRRENATPAQGERAEAKTFSSPSQPPLPDELDIIHLEFIERDTRHDKAIYNRDIGMAECAWLEHAVGVTTTAILVVGRNKTFVGIDDPRPVSVHGKDRAPLLEAVPDHAEPSACCPCVADKALCNAPKCCESRQLSFSHLHAASIERDMHSVDIDCILADAYDAVSSRASGHVVAKDHDACILHDMRT